MALPTSLRFVLTCIFISTVGRAQTVFVTSEKERPKQDEPGEFAGERPVYLQSAFSFPLGINPDYQASDAFDGEDDLSFLLPDGLSAHVGAGVHYQHWMGIGMNVGLDWKLNQKLVSAPVYVSAFLNPHFNETTSIMFQAGYGRAFALGRGRLSGVYQKYRAGLLSDELYIFAEVNLFGYGLHGVRETGSVNLGISLMDFFEKK